MQQVPLSSSSATSELSQSSVNNDTEMKDSTEVELNLFLKYRLKTWESLVNNPELLQKSVLLAKEEFGNFEGLEQEKEGTADWTRRSVILSFCEKATLALEQERRVRELQKLAELQKEEELAKIKKIHEEESAKYILLTQLREGLLTQAVVYYTLPRLQNMVGVIKAFNEQQKELNEQEFHQLYVGNTYATPILLDECKTVISNLQNTVQNLRTEVESLREQVSDLQLRLAVPSQAGSRAGSESGSRPASPRASHNTPTHQPDSSKPPLYSGIGIQAGLELGDQVFSQAYYTNEQARCAMQETRQQYGLAEHPLVLPTPDYEPKSHQAMNTPSRPQTPKRPPADHTFHKVDSSTSYSSSSSSSSSKPNPNPNPNPNPKKNESIDTRKTTVDTKENDKKTPPQCKLRILILT